MALASWMVVGTNLAALPNGSRPEGVIVALAEQRDDSKLRHVGFPTAPQVRTLRRASSWISLPLEDSELEQRGVNDRAGPSVPWSGSANWTAVPLPHALPLRGARDFRGPA